MKNDTKYSALIGQYLSGNISLPERKELFAWVETSSQNKAFFEEMVNLWTLADRYEDNFEADSDKAWAALSSRLQLNQKASAIHSDAKATEKGRPKIAKVVPFYRQLLKIAAVFLLMVALGSVVFYHFSKDPMMVVTTEKGERQEVQLPDGSKVWLNENTTFSYAETFEKREVFLEGEAFFDVEHLEGKTFEIFSGDTKVLVVGTMFNVRAYKTEQQVEVTVEEGIVKVSKKEEANTEQQITANQSIVFDKEKQELTPIEKEIPNAASWKKNSLTFGENTTLKEVVSSFERYYNIDIEVKNLGILSCDFTQVGTLKDPKLEEMIMILQIALDLKFTKKGDGYELDGQNCKENF